MPTYSPVLIVAGGQERSYGAQLYGPLAFNNNLYILLSNANVFCGVYKSTDGGATWAEVDAANHAPSGDGTACFDGDHTLIVAWRVAGAGLQEIRIQTFDLSTNLWGPVTGTIGAPSNCGECTAVFLRLSGVYTVFYTNRTGQLTGSGWLAANYTPGSDTWGVSFDAGGNVAAQGGWNPAFDRIITDQVTVALDSSDRMHCFGFCGGGLPTNFYQQLEADNSLGTFHIFAEDMQPFSGTPLGRPVIINSVLAVPAIVDFHDGNGPIQTLFTAVPLATPVFTVMPSPGLDPGQSPAFLDEPFDVANFWFDGTTLFAIWPRFNDAGDQAKQVQLGQTTNLADLTQGWSAQTIFDVDLDSPPGFNFAGQKIQIPSARSSAGVLYFAADAFSNQSILQEDRYWFGAFVPPTPPTALSFAFGGGGGRFRCCIPDAGPASQYSRMLALLRDSKAKIEEFPYPWKFSPPGADPVQEWGMIPAPIAGVLTAVKTYTVPQGMRLYLQAILYDVVQAGGFTPGDATWRTDTNALYASVQGAPVEGLQSVPIPLGSLEEGILWEFSRAYEFPSLTVLRSAVTNLNLAPGAPNYFLSFFFGYLVPE